MFYTPRAFFKQRNFVLKILVSKTLIFLCTIPRYDNGNNDWLLMNGNDNEWAIGFHGSTRKGTQAIAESRIFKAGTRQAYSRDIDTNKLSDNSGKPCGDGVYFAADIEIAQGYSRFSPEDSPCVLQVSQAC